MAFSQEQTTLLNGKLDPKNVRKPSGSFGPKGDYIEGWHAIAEANRIFGFDGWSYEAPDVTCVAQSERPIGRDKKPGWGVTYTAKVRCAAGGVVREDFGAGHGYDVDLGLAHESAIKEAVTDALKRALKSFGNPFGLALYDKSQANVGTNPDPRADDLAASMLKFIETIQTTERATQWWNDQSRKGDDGRNAFDALTDDGWAKVERAFKAKRYSLTKEAA